MLNAFYVKNSCNIHTKDNNFQEKVIEHIKRKLDHFLSTISLRIDISVEQNLIFC